MACGGQLASKSAVNELPLSVGSTMRSSKQLFSCTVATIDIQLYLLFQRVPTGVGFYEQNALYTNGLLLARLLVYDQAVLDYEHPKGIRQNGSRIPDCTESENMVAIP
ncbi:uncharacterized protein LOC134224887 [Armigeres subalbatus]|uniref:uncharacterized protein LOC134224887 n=1 Tax=Armigeres subalbatus TaxID=124917 RepID=UPI002ED3A944